MRDYGDSPPETVITVDFLRGVMDWAFDSWESGDYVSNRQEITTSASEHNTACSDGIHEGQR